MRDVHGLVVFDVRSEVVVVPCRQVTVATVGVDARCNLVLRGYGAGDDLETVALAVGELRGSVACVLQVRPTKHDGVPSVLHLVNPRDALPKRIDLVESIHTSAVTKRELTHLGHKVCYLRVGGGHRTDSPLTGRKVIHIRLYAVYDAVHALIGVHIGDRREMDAVVVLHDVTEKGYLQVLGGTVELDILVHEGITRFATTRTLRHLRKGVQLVAESRACVVHIVTYLPLYRHGRCYLRELYVGRLAEDTVVFRCATVSDGTSVP